jgi:biopolymer transport protein ExbD
LKIGSSKFNQINIVPFIDVMLVLLTIVLTTATFIAKGIIPVDLPEAKESQSLGQKKQIEIAIKEDGKIYYDGDMVSVAGLKDRVSTLDKKSSIIIKSDKKSAFENFVSVLEVLKTNNFENISILTKK